MPDVMAIVSKAIFEKAAGKAPQLGTKLAMDRYVSTNKNLEPVAAGGKLYLVTVRPPDEALWLVAVLENPHHDGKQWIASPCDTPLTDISELRVRIKFESGKGMSAAPGTLGMSLQTPRLLTAADVALLDGMLGGAKVAPAPGALAKGVPPPSDTAVAGNADRLAQLLAAVIADPDSDLARQVYADELVTRNDPRGELVQLELALAGPLSIRKRDLLRARQGELLAKHGATWFPYSLAFRANRGFIEAVTGSLSQLAASTALFAAEPVVEVTVTDGTGKAGAKKLADSPWLARTRRLVIRGTLGDDGFAMLVAAKSAQGLQALNVSVNEISSEGLESLGAYLPACRTLVLTANAFGDEGISALCQWRHLANLETLYLASCELTEEGVSELLAQSLPNLVKLSLSHNELDDAVAEAFVEHAGNVPALRHLELKNAGISLDAVETFKRSPLHLVRLDVRRNSIGRAEVADAPFVRGGQ